MANDGDTPEAIPYKYQEDRFLAELKEYIDKTYHSHYSGNQLQALEFVIDRGHGVGFNIGAIMKYAQRYGLKGGFNRTDILKIIHYALILLHIHDVYELEGKKDVHPLNQSDTMWVVGVDPTFPEEDTGWGFAGLYATEAEAVARCENERYWVAPQTVGQFITSDWQDWEGQYYPLLTEVDESYNYEIPHGADK